MLGSNCVAGGSQRRPYSSVDPGPYQSAARGLAWSALTLLLVSGAVAAGDHLAALRFATACAVCHEGECSGRLSFALAPEASFDHIRRYAGNVDEALARRLFEALVYMKEECAYIPLRALNAQKADEETLADYRDVHSGRYFVPLGQRSSGRYRLELRFDPRSSASIEVLDTRFDILAYECFEGDAPTVALSLLVETDAELFVRVRTPRGVRLVALGLAVDPLPSESHR